MIRLKNVFVFLIIAGSPLTGDVLHAQIRFDKKGNPLPPRDLSPVSHYKCFPHHHYPLAKRLSRHPFNKAKKVTLISFKTAESVLLPSDSLLQSGYCYEYTAVPVINDSNNRSAIVEEIVLSKGQTDTLTRMLYNYDYRNMHATPMPVTRTGCYAPHNAILFYNEMDSVFAYIELCFTCEGLEESDDMVDSGVPCLGKVALLKGFFRKNGIIIGTTKIPMMEILDIQLK